MSKLVVIGQSPAVVSAIQKIREAQADWEIVLVSTDGERPYDRALFPKLMSRDVKEKDLCCAPEAFYADHKVELMLDKEITRFNFSRRKVFLADRVQVDYDALLLADAPQPRLAEKKGIRKTGVFALARLDGVRKLIKYLPFAETIVVEAGSLLGIETALALKGLGKDVILVACDDKVLSSRLGDGQAAILSGLLEKRGIRVFGGTLVEDILGDVEVKAVRLKSGKVLAADMVVCDEVAPDLRFLADGDLVMGERITVMGTMRTNIAQVYAIDTVMEMQEPRLIGSYSLPTEVGRRQGEVASLNILGQEALFTADTCAATPSLESVFSAEEVKGVADEIHTATALPQESAEQDQGIPQAPVEAQGG